MQRPACVINWDDLEPWLFEHGHISSRWRDLGRAAGSKTVGLRRIELAEGGFSTPVHVHGNDEEVFFVLRGSGLLWQDGETFQLSGGDCVVFRPRTQAHTLRGGDDGLDVLAFGQRAETGLSHLPRAGISWAFPSWVEAGVGEHPFAREAAAGPPACPPPSAERPANVVALADAPTLFGGRLRRAGAAAGASASGLSHVALPAGATGAPAHCHSLEEEIFVVLEGEGHLLLYRGGPDRPEQHPVAAGDVISRPAGNGVAHALRAGAGGLTYLAYGTREPDDMCLYVDTGTVALRGIGVSFQPAGLQYVPERG